MRKSKLYYPVKFSSDLIRAADNLFININRETGVLNQNELLRYPTLNLTFDDCEWGLESLEEFLSEYPKAKQYYLSHWQGNNRFTIQCSTEHRVYISIEFVKREYIESIFQIFDDNKDKCTIDLPKEPIKIFIGHGKNNQWLYLKNHLHDLHGFDIIDYEVGPRAGLSIKDVLESMLNEGSFALLVLTGEDIKNDGELHARQNVVHELGLFQGRLGFKKAIVLIEEGVIEFSNILGVNQIRFSKNNIRETFGDVVATINREFKE